MPEVVKAADMVLVEEISQVHPLLVGYLLARSQISRLGPDMKFRSPSAVTHCMGAGNNAKTSQYWSHAKPLR